MKTLIACATKYGSTLQIGRWIAERLSYEGFTVDVVRPHETDSIDRYELIIMGSGIYSHYVLPELRDFMEKNKDVLKEKKLALFGVAMKTTAVFHKGKIHGGIEHLKPAVEMFGDAIVHMDMLHGEMVPQKMDEKDKEGLLRFYKMLGLDEEETKRRMSPRTLMDKKECWEFAEAVIKKAREKKAGHYGYVSTEI